MRRWRPYAAALYPDRLEVDGSAPVQYIEMNRSPLFALAFLIIAARGAPAQTGTQPRAPESIALEAAAAVPEDPATLLGMSPSEAIARFGSPASVFAVRGAEPWQDDVVFDYGGGFSLFLFKDRVWQVRVAEPFSKPVLGFIVGSTPERAAATLGSPARALEAAFEWVLPGEAWPVRLRGIVDQSGSIRELYIYRADF